MATDPLAVLRSYRLPARPSSYPAHQPGQLSLVQAQLCRDAAAPDQGEPKRGERPAFGHPGQLEGIKRPLIHLGEHAQHLDAQQGRGKIVRSLKESATES